MLFKLTFPVDCNFVVIAARQYGPNGTSTKLYFNIEISLITYEVNRLKNNLVCWLPKAVIKQITSFECLKVSILP